MNTDYLYNKEFRKKLIDDPKSALTTLNADYSKEFDIVVKKATKKITYFVIPSEGIVNQSGSDSLNNINAAGCAGSASTIGSGGCASTLATATSTASTAGTAGSIGSVASAGSR